MVNLKFLSKNQLRIPVTLEEWLLASSGFACVLLMARVIATGLPEYLFLPWNLLLAFVPYWISQWVLQKGLFKENRVQRYLALAAWLLFIPNSFYIITDLFHLVHVRTAPKWFDLLLIFSFAWNGIIGGILSLRHIETFIELSGGRKYTGWLIAMIMWLSGLGIYIGRFLRYNSWDILTNPFSLAGDILDLVIHPFQNAYAWGMTGCYAIFMTLLYFTIKKISESFIMIK